MKYFKSNTGMMLVAGVAVYLGLLLSPLMATTTVQAEDIKDSLCGGASLSVTKADGNTCAKNDCYEREDPGNENSKCVKDSSGRINGLITTAINIFSLIVGIIAVIMIILGGFRFITSGGDSGKISSAKSTVIYAIIGLIIVALAQVIVRFVLGKVT